MLLIAAGRRHEGSIAVIAPYRAQARLLRLFVDDLAWSDRVRVSTVHRFQGDEADMVAGSARWWRQGVSMGVPRPTVDGRMRREWEPEDLVACWTLVEAGRDLIANKTGATRLGFVLLLKYFELEGRFPRHAAEVPRQAVSYLGEQLRLDPNLFGAHVWSGRTTE